MNDALPPDTVRTLEPQDRPTPLPPDVPALGASLEQADRTQRLGMLRLHQQQVWQRGGRFPAEEYLRHCPSLQADEEGVLDLIYNEVLLREQLGESPRLEEYQDRFPSLAASLERLFAFHAGLKESWLQTTSRQPATPAPPPTLAAPGSGAAPATSQPQPPARYRPVRLHAKGGLGEVVVARDEELHRDVALKRIREPYAADSSSRRRFLQEAEITGRLEHPGNVPVYGLVFDAEGRPSYAMRFIEGETLQEALERFHKADRPGRDPGERRLALRQLLARFIAACNAIAYAHDRGVVHRDLKPANIMLGKYGETLVVDWGLAKTVGSRQSVDGGEAGPAAAASADATQLGLAIGTPPYMSPEQAAGRWDVLGPASDVYSLGATLYTVLTGQPPVRGRNVEETVALVREGKVVRPRQRNKLVPPALEAVCLKAMAPRTEDRYPTPLHLAGDLESWLADEPVGAYAEPASVRARRWLRRHRPVVAGAVTLLLTAVVALACGTLLIWHEQQRTEEALVKERDARSAAKEAEDRAREKAEQEKAARLAAKQAEGLAREKAEQERQARARAEENAETARQVSAFLAGLFQVADPTGLRGYGFRAGSEQGQKLNARELLERGSRQLRDELKDKPAVRAALLDSIGNVYRSLALYGEAEPLLQEALTIRRKQFGDDSLETAESTHSLGWLHHDRGDYLAALPLYRQALEVRRKHLGPDDPAVTQSEFDLAWLLTQMEEYPEAERLFKGVIRRRERLLPAGHREIAIGYAGLAAMLLDQGRIVEAAKPSRLAMEVFQKIEGTEKMPVAVSHFQAGLVAKHFGQYETAVAELRECVTLARGMLGDSHPYLALALHELADALEDAGDLSGAESSYRECLAIARKAPGLAHPKALIGVSHLAYLLARTSRAGEGEGLFEELIRARRERFGDHHPVTAEGVAALAGFVANRGNLDRAERLYHEAEAVFHEHPDYRTGNRLAAGNGLAALLVRRKRPAEAEAVLQTVLSLTWPQGRGATFYRLGLLDTLAAAQLDQRRYDEAETTLVEARKLCGSTEARPWQKADVLDSLGRLHEARGRPADAAKAYREALAEARGQKDIARLARQLDHLAGALVEQRDYAAAQPLLTEHVKLARAQQPANPAYTARRLADAALVKLAAGDREGHLAACAQLHKEFGTTTDPAVAEAVVRCLVLSPKGTGDWGPVVALAEKAAGTENRADALKVIGAALCRAGRPDDAVSRLQKAVAVRNGEGDAVEYLFLALAEQARHQTDEARRWLEKARNWIGGQARQDGELSWQYRLEARLLLAEAEEALGEKKPR